MIDKNGEYGCMGDLGLHVCHVPLRAGWQIRNVRAILSNIVRERPDSQKKMVPCQTWDNAILFCSATSAQQGDEPFPLTMKMQRIAPGEKNTWYFEVLGTRACARFSTKNPKLLQILEYQGGEQIWQSIDMGHETAFRTHTGASLSLAFPTQFCRCGQPIYTSFTITSRLKNSPIVQPRQKPQPAIFCLPQHWNSQREGKTIFLA